MRNGVIYDDSLIYKKTFPGPLDLRALFPHMSADKVAFLFGNNFVGWDNFVAYYGGDFTEFGRFLWKLSDSFWYIMYRLVPYTFNIPEGLYGWISFDIQGNVYIEVTEKPPFKKTTTGLKVTSSRTDRGTYECIIHVGLEPEKLWDMAIMDREFIAFVREHLYLDKRTGDIPLTCAPGLENL